MLQEEVARYTESHHIILCGDFNSRTGCAPDYDNNINVLNERCNEDGVINKYGRSLLNFCINTELKIANGRMFDDKSIGRYTYYSPMGASTIDYMILREDYMTSKFKVLPKLVESDHCPIKFHILNSKLRELSSAEMNINGNDSSPCSDVYICYDDKKIEYQASLRNEQTFIAFEEMLCAAAEGCGSDNLCDIFNGMLENAISPLFLKKQHKSNCKKNIKNNFPSNPWYDKECKSLKHVLNNIAKDKKFNTRQVEYNIMLRQYKQLIQKKKRHYRKFWKSLKPRNSTKGPTLSQFVKYFEEQVYPSHVEYFDYDHMNNIMKLVKSSLNDINEKVENGQSDLLHFLNSPITIDRIQKAIRKLKCKKAAGIDSIPAEFYKHGCNELLPALVLLFNTIIANGEYPSSWATGIIHPVHKKAAHNGPDNYRKVTVMPCIGKLFESVF